MAGVGDLLSKEDSDSEDDDDHPLLKKSVNALFGSYKEVSHKVTHKDSPGKSDLFK